MVDRLVERLSRLLVVCNLYFRFISHKAAERQITDRHSCRSRNPVISELVRYNSDTTKLKIIIILLASVLIVLLDYSEL